MYRDTDQYMKVTPQSNSKLILAHPLKIAALYS